MEYSFGIGDGHAQVWGTQPDLDLGGSGTCDAVALDFDGDGLRDDAMWDTDGDDVADVAVLDLDDDGAVERYFEDPEDPDGLGTWSRELPGRPGGTHPDVGPHEHQLHWTDLGGAAHTATVQHRGGTLNVDFDGDGATDDTVADADGDGTADTVMVAENGSVRDVLLIDTDRDGVMDVQLLDSDGDGHVDAVLCRGDPGFGY